MLRFRALCASLHVIVLVGCLADGAVDADDPTSSPVLLGKADAPSLLMQVERIPAGGKAYVLDEARLVGTDLEVDVTYIGGCLENRFDLYWDGEVTGPPASAELHLIRTASGTECDGIRHKTLVFDVAALGASAPLVISLRAFEDVESL